MECGRQFEGSDSGDLEGEEAEEEGESGDECGRLELLSPKGSIEQMEA